MGRNADRFRCRFINAWSRHQAPCPLAAVALTVDLDDRAVVHQPVHRCHRHGAGGEHVLLLAELLVAGHQQGAAFVAVHHQLKQHRGFGLVLVHVADVIDHDQGVAFEAVERLGQGLVGLCTLQFLHLHGGREKPR